MSGSESRRRRHNKVVDLCFLEAVSTTWESSEDIAARACMNPRQAMNAGVRLAKTGVIEQRTTSWRSARCRVRHRFEYRLPFLDARHAITPWELFPTWLLPPMQPLPDSSFIRRIRGRHIDLTEDKSPMTEIELNELPRGVRERFADIKDAAFGDHPLVITARERLDEHQDRHADCVETITVFRARIDQLLQQQREARYQLKVIADSRRKIIAEALLAGDDLSADIKARTKCAELEHRIEAIDLGMPVIRRQFDQAVEACRNVAISVQADEEHLRGVLDGLKLEEAKRLAYE